MIHGSAMLRRLLTMLLLTAAHLAATGELSAQTTAPGSSSITINNVLFISVTNLSVTFPAVTQAHYTAGYVIANNTSLVTSRGNIAHSVTVKADVASMSATGSGARPNKPASDLQVRIRPSGGAWGSATGLTIGDLSVIANRPAGDHSGAPPEIEYRILLNWAADSPGTYTLPFTFTVIPG
jgi:hypothetical protein